MDPDHVFSHITAAELWRMPLPNHLDRNVVHVTASAPRRAPTGKSVVGHSLALSADAVTLHSGMRVTSPSATWVHLSSLLPAHDLVAVGDFILTGDPYGSVVPLAERSDLECAHRASRSARGRRARELALSFLRAGALSRPEPLLRYLIERAGLPQPDVNESLYDGRGSFIAMPDLSWPEFRLALEYEGDHHPEVRQFRRDVARIERMVDAGWAVTKITADDLFGTPEATVALLARRLTARGWMPRPLDLRRIGHFGR